MAEGVPEIEQRASAFFGGFTLIGCDIHGSSSGSGVEIEGNGRARIKRCRIFANQEAGVRISGQGKAAIQRCKIHHNGQAGVEFRDGGWIGANAFALPGGIVVMTDQLVELMANDNQIAAVLAHEIGHVHHRHSLRYVLQDSIIALAAMAIYGDASAVAGVAVTLPTVLLHAHYSRDFEREADNYAFELLKDTGRSPRELGLALAALEAGKNMSDTKNSDHKTDADSNNKQLTRKLSYLSSHPATQERIEAAENAAR